MEEGVRAIAKTYNFQSEHVRLKTIFLKPFFYYNYSEKR